MLRSEQLKIEIDKVTQEMIDELDNYENECNISVEEYAKKKIKCDNRPNTITIIKTTNVPMV